ncbi:hypothetical protein CR492_20300, partial [Methylocella silvestris]
MKPMPAGAQTSSKLSQSPSSMPIDSKFGRNRTNVWNYPGANAFARRGRTRGLDVHPTVKPIAMVADAILDATQRGDIILDPFCGSGT